jgi:predicted ATP-grasp superfamily ATP-dependent carboligase
VSAVDLFADRDLRAIADTVAVRSVADDLCRVAGRLPPGHWMYTGALENHPDVVEQVSQQHTLCGNPGSVLRRVRDPQDLARVFHQAGIRYPEFSLAPPPLTNGTWVGKPLRSCGGNGVHRLVPENLEFRDSIPGKRHRYWQRWIDGAACSAMYVAAAGESRLLGVSRQLVGCDWCGARGFQYAGNIGPLPIDDRVLSQYREIGECLADRFQLCGLFGVDVVVREQQVWTIEVNPRYCASVEVFERGLCRNFLDLHLAACIRSELPVVSDPNPSRVCGKAVVYAREAMHVTSRCLDGLHADCNVAAGRTWIADIPYGETDLKKGHPLMTVLAEGADEQQVLSRLQRNALRVYDAIAEA